MIPTYQIGQLGRAYRARPRPLFANVKFLANFTGSNGSTTLTDLSSSARTLTIQGAPTIKTDQSAFGAGSSLYLPGAGTDYITMPDSADWAVPANTDFCWEFILRPDGNLGSNADILSQATGTGSYPIRLYRQSGANGGVGVLIANSGGSLIVNATGGALLDSQFGHVAFSRDGTSYRIRINGAVVSTATPATAEALFNAANTMKFGAYNPPSATNFKGWIQSARYTLGEPVYAGASSYDPPVDLLETS